MDLAGAHVDPAPTVLAQSAVAEGDELFLALLVQLRRCYPDVYYSSVGMSWTPERREIEIREGEGLIGGSSSVHSSIKLGAYAGRLANLNLAEINIRSPNLTTVYLDNPLVGPTLDPIEYVPLPGRIGQPIRYPLTITGAYIGGSRRCPLPHPHHITLTDGYILPLVGRNRSG